MTTRKIILVWIAALALIAGSHVVANRARRPVEFDPDMFEQVGTVRAKV